MNATPVLEVAHLRYAYPDGHVAIDDVSLALRRGEKVALVGPNGAGKSTLMLTLNGVLSPPPGTVRVAGLEVAPPNLSTIRARVGLVFQNPDDQLFSPTVRDDVAFGPLHMNLAALDVRARVARALDQVGMGAYADRLSHHLSVGEKKRIAIATVLAMDPEILVFDEPTAGLDPRGRRQLIDLMTRLPQTMLVSSHDMRFVATAFTRVIVVDRGRIVADGPTAEVMADEAFLVAHGLERG